MTADRKRRIEYGSRTEDDGRRTQDAGRSPAEDHWQRQLSRSAFYN